MKLLKHTKIEKVIKKASEYLQLFKFSLIDSSGIVKSLWIFVFRSIKRPGVFYGYQSYSFAEKYKAKRETNWSHKWDQMGKQQGIFPLDELRLIVCSRMELIAFQKKGLISRKIKPRKLMKKSY